MFRDKLSILSSDSNPSWRVFTFVRLRHSTVTCTRVFFASGSRAGIGETGPTTAAKATGRFSSLQSVDVRVLGHWSTDVLFGNVLLSSSISTDVTDAPKSSKATRFAACSWESLIWFEEGVGTGNGTAEHFFDWTIFWIELFTSWRLFKSALRFFSAQRQFLQMYMELISTLHSKDSSSSRKNARTHCQNRTSYYCRERKWKILYKRLRLQSPRKWKRIKSRYFSDVMMYEK